MILLLFLHGMVKNLQDLVTFLHFCASAVLTPTLATIPSRRASLFGCEMKPVWKLQFIQSSLFPEDRGTGLIAFWMGHLPGVGEWGSETETSSKKKAPTQKQNMTDKTHKRIRLVCVMRMFTGHTASIPVPFHLTCPVGLELPVTGKIPGFVAWNKPNRGNWTPMSGADSYREKKLAAKQEHERVKRRQFLWSNTQTQLPEREIFSWQENFTAQSWKI